MGHFLEVFQYSIKSAVRIGVFVSAALIIIGGTQGASQEDDTDQRSDPPSEQIQIRSDSLVADNQSKVAEFIGNVWAAQGDTVIEAERLKVYYGSGGQPSTDPETLAAQVEKIVASGNVRIRFQNRLAVTHEAVYNIRSQVFILSGEGTRVTSGNSYIVGEKITLRRKDGQVVVVGGESQQVEAVFYPEEAENKQGPQQPGPGGPGSSGESE